MDLTAQKEDLLKEKVTVNRRLKEQEEKKAALLKQYKKLVNMRKKIPTGKDSLRVRKTRAKRMIEPAERSNNRAKRGSRQKQINTVARILTKKGLIPISPSDVEEVISEVDDTVGKNFAGVYFSNNDSFERIERGKYLFKGE